MAGLMAGLRPSGMSGFFFNVGRKLGHKAVPAIRKSKWIWDSLTGDEDEALNAEKSLGTAMATELRSVADVVNDPQLEGLVQGVCQRLTACVKDKRRTFHCEIIADAHPNAMALPGGFIFISGSLLELCERQEDRVAFAIGHEMAHVIRRHVWDRMVNEAVLRAASTIVARSGRLGGWLRQSGLPLLRSAYSRDREVEADELGLRLAVAAGFSPAGAIALMQAVARLEPDAGALGQYFGSHPDAAQRIAHLARLCHIFKTRTKHG